MVFDWELAAIRIMQSECLVARAGLRDDWEWTGGRIWENGKPVPSEDTYVYLASTWAVPELELDGLLEECYKMEWETPGWDAETYWPPQALVIVGLETGEA